MCVYLQPSFYIVYTSYLEANSFGYDGQRIEIQQLTLNSELSPNSNTHKVIVTGVSYLEATFDLLVTKIT